MQMAEKRPKMKRPLQVSALLETVFAGKATQKRIREARVWKFWEEAVGAHIASKATPASFRDGMLTVKVSSSPWMQQLSMMKADIVASINSALGEPLVTDLFFRQGVVHREANDPAEKTVEKRPLSDNEKKQLLECTSEVADQELRDAFISFFSSQLAASPRKQTP
jgi:predicted nucleic acid-binding Zn ribbon protein